MKTKIIFITLLVCISQVVSAREGSVNTEADDVHPPHRFGLRYRLAREDSINTGEDFTRPLDRLDFRYKYQQKTGTIDRSSMILRRDAHWMLEDDWKFSTRFDLPFTRTNAPSSDNPNGDYEAGSGDILSQFLLISPPADNWAYGFGVRFLWPTASQDQMGTGKYQVAPGFGINYYPDSWSDGSFVGIRLADYFDYAGDDDRADIHQASIRAGFSYNFSNDCFISSFSDMRINWEQDGNWFVPLNLKVGRIFDKKRVVSIEFNTPIVNDYDRYDWQVELQLGFFF